MLAATTGTLYLAGGAAVLSAVLDDPVHSGPLVLIGAVAVVAGTLVLVRGRYLPPAAISALVTAGTVLISAAVLLAPMTSTALVLSAVFTFVAIDVFYYFALRQALVQLALLLAAGATTLVARGVPPGAVVAHLVVLVAVAVVVRDLSSRAARASRDPLTGALNRRGFDDALESALLEARRRRTPLGLAVVDLDHFKAVNDTSGHASGDLLLQRVASALEDAVPETAAVARTGGDEFVVLLPGADAVDALPLLEAARRSAGHPLSVGLVTALPDEEPGDLLRRADRALYRAKHDGRDRTVLGDGDEDGASGGSVADRDHRLRDRVVPRAVADGPAAGAAQGVGSRVRGWPRGRR